jgi:hypothetical protein
MNSQLPPHRRPISEISPEEMDDALHAAAWEAHDLMTVSDARAALAQPEMEPEPPAGRPLWPLWAAVAGAWALAGVGNLLALVLSAGGALSVAAATACAAGAAVYGARAVLARREGGIGIARAAGSAATRGPEREKKPSEKTSGPADDGFDDDLDAVFAAAQPPTSFVIPPDVGGDR